MMRHRVRQTFVVGTICFGLAILASGVAWSRGPERHKGKGEPLHEAFLIEKYAERLQLDDKTLEQVRGIVAASKERSGELRRELHEAHMTMRKLLSAERPDEKAVLEQADKIDAIRNNLAKNHLRVLLQIRPLLTTEQVRELGKIRGEHRSRRRHWGTPRQDAGYDQERGPRAMDLDSRISKLTQRLSLTEEQQAEIRSIFAAEREKMQAMREEQRKLRQETDAKIQGLLTAEQRAQFMELREERQHKKMRDRGGWGKPSSPR